MEAEKKCKTCGACKECGASPQYIPYPVFVQPWPQPVTPYRPYYPGITPNRWNQATPQQPLSMYDLTTSGGGIYS